METTVSQITYPHSYVLCLIFDRIYLSERLFNNPATRKITHMQCLRVERNAKQQYTEYTSSNQNLPRERLSKELDKVKGTVRDNVDNVLKECKIDGDDDDDDGMTTHDPWNC